MSFKLEDLLRLDNYGTCPGCQERKFIGHGPLCNDCHFALAPSDSGDAAGQEES